MDNKHQQYEQEKAKLLPMTSKEYEQAIKKIVKKLKI